MNLLPIPQITNNSTPKDASKMELVGGDNTCPQISFPGRYVVPPISYPRCASPAILDPQYIKSFEFLYNGPKLIMIVHLIWSNVLEFCYGVEVSKGI
jgi:hypothetical protein